MAAYRRHGPRGPSRSRARARRQPARLLARPRAVLQPFCHLYFRLSRIGREHIPAEGPVIIASNHRSFLDPFVIGDAWRGGRSTSWRRRSRSSTGRPRWLLSSLGAFPIDRGAADQEAMATARAILERGDGVLIFPEGTRTRPGPLGRPKRGVGRLALETGAPVVPVAVIGTEAVRSGWRIRPHKVRIRAGAPLTFPHVDEPSPPPRRRGHRPHLAVRRAAVGVAGRPAAACAAPPSSAPARGAPASPSRSRAPASRSTSAPRRRAGDRLGDARDDRTCPACAARRHRRARAAELELAHHDLVCLAVPPRELPAVVAALGAQHPRARRRARALQGPRGARSARCPAPTSASACGRAPSPASAARAPQPTRSRHGAALVVACADAGLPRPSSPTCCAPPASTCSARPTSPASSSPARRRNAAVAGRAAGGTRAAPNVAGAAAGRVLGRGRRLRAPPRRPAAETLRRDCSARRPRDIAPPRQRRG